MLLIEQQPQYRTQGKESPGRARIRLRGTRRAGVTADYKRKNAGPRSPKPGAREKRP